MNNDGQITAEFKQIQDLLDRSLRSGSLRNRFKPETSHLDEDSLAVFAEGNLSEREAKPIISHLAACSYCRHISAELVKLDLAVADVPPPEVRTEQEPTKVGDVLNGILGRIFGAGDEAVFAHNEKDDEEEDENEVS